MYIHVSFSLNVDPASLVAILHLVELLRSMV